MPRSFSFLSYLLCCALIIGVALWYPKWEKPQTEATLSWDVMGYYLYLPAAIIYKDLKKLSFKDQIIKDYHPTTGFYQAFLHESGNYVMKYPIGLAILYLPFFLIAHLLAIIGGYPTDGFSLPYQMGISWGSIFMACLGLWLMRKLLSQYFSDRVVGGTLLLTVFATNYLNYTAIDGSMSHNWVFTLVAILMLLSIQWYKKPNFKNSIGIGLCIGLAALSRPTDILICLIPVFWGIQQLSDFKERFSFWQKHLSYLITIVCTVVLIGSIQLVYWKYASGDWLVYSYEDQGFSWLTPHVKDVLISYRKGWLIYTPIMIFALAGFVYLYRHYKILFWGTFAYFILHFYITAAWDIWWYGGSFGQRALIQAYPVLLFPLAAFLETHLINSKNVSTVNKKEFGEATSSKKTLVSKLSTLKKPVLLVFALFCSWLNIFQTYQAHGYGHGFEVDAMTKAYYWRIFGNTNPTILDKKLLDTREDYQGKRTNIQTIYTNDFETNLVDTAVSTQQVHAGQQALLINAKNVYSPEFNIPLTPQKNKWLRVQAQFYAPQRESEVWRMAQLIVQFKKEEEVVKKRMIRVHRQIGERLWQLNWTDMYIGKGDFDSISIVFWNAGGEQVLYVDDLVVEVYEPL